MSEAFKHLSRGAREALAKPPAERIAYMQRDHWIRYDRADQVLAKMEEILAHPRVIRMPCMMLVGEPNNGKSRIMRRFSKLHPPIDDAEGMKVPVLHLDDLKDADERSLYNGIIDKFGFPNNPSQKIPTLEYKAYQLLIEYDVQVLMLDEFNVFAEAPTAKQRKLLNIFKVMSNRRQMSFICAGTRDAFNLMQLDQQFSSRFKPEVLRPWEDIEHWQRLMGSFESIIPLPEPSGLSEENFARRLMVTAEYTIGDGWDLLKKMGEYAMRKNAKRLTTDLINEVDWIAPSKRVEFAQKAAAPVLV